MAGDWIKVETDTPDKPEVLAIAARLEIDPDLVMGKLIKMWRWFDKHTVDGNARGVTFFALNNIIGVKGFAEAVHESGWLVKTEDGVQMPNFDYHTSKSAKNRALGAKRSAEMRTKNAKAYTNSNDDSNENRNAAIVTSALPREEKRREEIIPPIVPQTGDIPEKKSRTKSEQVTLKTFLERCKQSGEKAISDYQPLLDYCQRAGLPTEFWQLCWLEFKREHLPVGKNESRKQADWRRHFRNYVEKNYYRLWYLDGSEYKLTSTGLQAERFHKAEAA